MTHENNPSETVNSIFAQRFYQLFKSKNITQDTLASYLGVSRQMIALYYKDKSVPSYEILIKIADYFDVTTDYLLGRTDDPSPHPSAVEELGLSPSVIDHLKSLNYDAPEAQKQKEALDFLLSSSSLKALLDDINQYLSLVHSYYNIKTENDYIFRQYIPYEHMRRTLGIKIKFLPEDVRIVITQNYEKLKDIKEDQKYRLFRLHGTISYMMENYFETFQKLPKKDK